MRRTVTLSVALVFAAAMAVAAQSMSGSQSNSSKSSEKVTLTGCLKAGTTDNSYTLTNVSGDMDMSAKAKSTTGQQGTSGMSGAQSSTMSDVTLMPASKSVDLKEHVGHKIEVTGMWAKSNKPKSGMAGTSGQSGSNESDMRELKVSSLKHLAATCSSQ